MRKCKTPILIATAVLLLVGLLLFATREEDPLYQGKPLSGYLQNHRGDGLVIFSGNSLEPRLDLELADSKAIEAISNVGPQALPMLVRMLNGGDSKIESWLRPALQRFPLLQRIIHLKAQDQWRNRVGSAMAFRQLGQRAAPAVPSIIPLLKDPNSALVAIIVLMHIINPERERDILSLTNVFSLQPSMISGGHLYHLQAGALLAIGHFGPKASAAEPFLIGCLCSTNGPIQAAAAVALARIGSVSKQVIPVMTRNLPQTNPPSLPPPSLWNLSMKAEIARFEADSSVRLTIWALAQYGERARMALPVLSNLQHYPRADVQDDAKEAASKIRGDTNVWFK